MYDREHLNNLLIDWQEELDTNRYGMQHFAEKAIKIIKKEIKNNSYGAQGVFLLSSKQDY